MNRKRREKRQREAYGNVVHFDIESYGTIDHAIWDGVANRQMLMYGCGARFSALAREASCVFDWPHPQIDRAVADQNEEFLGRDWSLYNTHHTSTGRWPAADYAHIERRIVAQMKRDLERQIERALYGVNPPEKIALDKAGELATSSSTITIAKMIREQDL